MKISNSFFIHALVLILTVSSNLYAKPIIHSFSFSDSIIDNYGEASAKFIRVHFLYGSRPAAQYRFIEPKWFGGMLGGHVGIGLDSSRILNFVHQGTFHLVTNKHNKHSNYIISTPDKFNSILGGNCNKVKTLTILIPIQDAQLKLLDSISNAYLKQSPYDYALLGMRCGAASYDILSQLSILPGYTNSQTAMKILYPKILRRQLLKKAKENGWTMIRQEGSEHRIWERD